MAARAARCLSFLLSSVPSQFPPFSYSISFLCPLPTPYLHPHGSAPITFMCTTSSTDPQRPSYPVGKHGSPTQLYLSDAKLQSLSSGDAITIPRSELRHLRARRLRDGSSLTLFNSSGDSISATLQGQYAIIDNDSSIPSSSSSKAIHVVVAAMKSSSRSDWLVEKLTELGVASISIVHTTRCSLPLDVIQGRKPRWTRVAVAAAKQSTRTDVPSVNGVSWPDAMESVRSATTAFVLCSGGESLLMPTIVERTQSNRSATFIIGPEGGLTEKEIEELQLAGAIPIGLGTGRLRTETAAMLTAGLIGQIMDVGIETGREREEDGGVPSTIEASRN